MRAAPRYSLKGALLAGLLVAAGGLALPLIGQRGMIYFPRPYDSSYLQAAPAGTVELALQTAQGRQLCFYTPPAADPQRPPDMVWFFFGGNASLALDWSDVVEDYAALESRRRPATRTGFLLFDYPGFGRCAGSPSARRIAESSEAALARLAEHLAITPDQLEGRISVLGHSLGAAAGLQFAARHRVARVVLIAPFTSLRDMARRVVGWPLCHLLLENYDNRARLDELAAHRPRPAVTIIHGDADEIVPVAMGRELARRHGDWIVYHESRGGHHADIISIESRRLLAAMIGGTTDAPGASER